MKLKRDANSFQNTNSETPTNDHVAKVRPNSRVATKNKPFRDFGPSGHRAASNANGTSHQQPAARSKSRPMAKIGTRCVGASSDPSLLNNIKPARIAALNAR